MEVQEIEQRVEELAASFDFSYAEIFRTVCQEFRLDGKEIAEVLGCECPYALIGYLEQEENA
jgi:hypothetical protein